MTTNNNYNPLFRATRAALAELTTTDARRWYWQQLRTSAALVHQGLTHIQRWLGASRGQVVVEPVQEHDATAIELAVNVPAATTASELGNVSAALATIEANDTPTATLSEQAISVAESSAAAAALELEPELLNLAATEQNTDDERLDDSLEFLTGADEPLVEDGSPFSDELECGPPFLKEEEDTSLYAPETKDESGSLLEDDLELSASVLPSDLNERVKAYLQAHGISAEPEHESNSLLSSTTTSSYGSIGAEFGE